MRVLTLIAHAEAETAKHGAEKSAGLFSALGIDARILVLQLIAFAVLVWVLSKWVYPVMVRAIDKREAAIAESVAAASEAEARAEASQAEIAQLLKEARDQAAMIVDTAHKDAAQSVKDAEDKAAKRAEQIVADARQQLDQDVAKARQALRGETAELVVLATEQILAKKITSAEDKQMIEKALKGAA